MKISFDQLADLSPNMRKVLKSSAGKSLHPGSTYWMTLMGMCSRGLIEHPKHPSQCYELTALGRAYRSALKPEINYGI